MIPKLTLSSILTVCLFLASSSSFANIITYNGGPIINYTLGANDTLYIACGTYTGTVSGLNSNNRTIIVASGATFQPASLAPTNGVVCKIKNYGTFTYTASLTTNTSFTLDNYAGGVVNLADVSTKGKDQVWTNNVGGTINFSGPILINGGTLADDNNVFINYETINASSSVQMNSGSSFTNYKDFNVAGNFTANGGTLNNQGNLLIQGQVELKNGAAEIKNYCRMQTAGDISISSGSFYNYSYLWAQNSTITLSGSGTIQNIEIPGSYEPPMVHAKNFTQTGGTMNGPARLYFWGTTTMTGGVMGVAGSTTDTIKMNDITRTNPPQIVDAPAGGPGGTIHPNVIYKAWGAPDSLVTYMFGCSVEIFLEIPLAINWRSFDLIVSDNIPLLQWSAEFDRQTVFEIQRSYDGRSFSTIDKVFSTEGLNNYKYSDRWVNNQTTIAYYRIRAVEFGGDAKYSQTRIARFIHRSGEGIDIAPNPFTGNFNINYRAAEKETLAIRIFNASGQQMLTKNVTVGNGVNNISIDEAAQFTKGIYVVQVSKGNNVISSGKIIKQ